MGKGKSQTIGFHYLFSILFGLSRGPINELRAIKVGDKIAWEGHLCNGTPSSVNSPSLFGGEEKEGGIQGPFRLQLGAADQVLPGATSVNVGGSTFGGLAGAVFSKIRGPYSGSRTLPAIKELIGGRVSEMRGVTTLWFDGLISSMNPYPKEWKFRVRRQTAGWQNDVCWYPTKAAIYLASGTIHAMNPAHIVYECLTNASWGRGLASGLLDENSFIYSANTFCAEGFGLCLLWTRKEDIDQFIQTVLDHVGAVLYLDPEDGLMNLRPIRNDYVVEALPLFTPGTGLIEITEDDSTSTDQSFNEVIGTGHDPITDEDFQLRVHNLAARHSQGAANPDAKQYPGIPTRELLSRVIQRDLKVHASGLTKLRVTLDRAGWKIRPGMCFRVSDPRRGIAEIVLRAGEIEDNPANDGQVQIRAMQDLYSLPTTSFVTPTESTWEAPKQEAEPSPQTRLIEAGYRDFVMRGGRSITIGESAAIIGQLAVAPNSVSYQYELPTRAAGEAEFRLAPTATFTGTATLTTALTPLATEASLASLATFGEENEGQALLIGDEVVELVSFDPLTNIAILVRGTADTVPAAHEIGARLWTLDDDLAFDGREYVSGETVESYVLTKTASDVLLPSETTPETIVLKGRLGLPYPPGNVRVDGDSIFALAQAEYELPVLTWAHRDRVLQEDQLVGHGDGSVGPEAGVTYTIRVYANDGVTLLDTYANIASDTWTYDAVMQGAHGSPIAVWMELESVRDGLASSQKYRFNVSLQAGYGIGYGNNYGGA